MINGTALAAVSRSWEQMVKQEGALGAVGEGGGRGNHRKACAITDGGWLRAVAIRSSGIFIHTDERVSERRL